MAAPNSLALEIAAGLERARGRRLSKSERAELYEQQRMVQMYADQLARFRRTNRAVTKIRED